jgi:hypothetical protein
MLPHQAKFHCLIVTNCTTDIQGADAKQIQFVSLSKSHVNKETKKCHTQQEIYQEARQVGLDQWI